MGRIVIWIVGLALLSVVYMATIYFQTANIEKDLTNRVKLALSKNNIGWASVQISGRDVMISGQAPTREAIDQVEQAARSVWGVRMAFCQCNSQDNTTGLATSHMAQAATPSIIVANQLTGQAAACQQNIDQLLSQQTIQFPSASSIISEASLTLMDQLVSIVQTCPEYQIEIGGHTDSYGNEQENSDLSLQRALAVLQFMQNAGIPKDRLKAIGYGANSPIDTNTTSNGRQRNRRIEFHIIP